MFFNGVTLILIIMSFGVGIWIGIRSEQANQRQLRDNWLNGETIGNRMKRDGWYF